MSDSAVDIAALTKSVEELGLKIRQMKNDGAPKGEVVVAVEQLKDLKAKLSAAVGHGMRVDIVGIARDV